MWTHTNTKPAMKLRSSAKAHKAVYSGLIAACVCLIPSLATAQSVNAGQKSNAWSSQTLTSTVDTLNLNITPITPVDVYDGSLESGVDLNLKNTLFDLQSDSTAPLFQFDDAGSLCLDTAESCALNDDTRMGFDYTRAFAKDGYKNIDLSLTPRAGVSYDEGSSSALVGALVKIGDNLTADSDMKENTWYLFAGADAQALTYTPDGPRRIYDGQFQLRNQIIVGDAQAGVAYRLGDADLSLTYLRRESRAEDYEFIENAAALSVTWRR